MKKMNKTQYEFYKKDGVIYQYVLKTDCYHVLRNMKTNENILVTEKELDKEYTILTEDDMAAETYNMSDSEYRDFIHKVGAYVCPFCGGTLQWESDFMTSEVRGLESNYYKITNKERIAELEGKKDEYLKSNLMSETDDIDALMKKVDESGYYDTMFVFCKGDFYYIDDPVIGIYECGRCHKRYEVQDAYEYDNDTESEE